MAFGERLPRGRKLEIRKFKNKLKTNALKEVIGKGYSFGLAGTGGEKRKLKRQKNNHSRRKKS
jgi:hypothetical protein